MSIEVTQMAFNVAIVTEGGDKIRFIADDKSQDYFVLETSSPQIKLTKALLSQMKQVLSSLGQAQIQVK